MSREEMGIYVFGAIQEKEDKAFQSIEFEGEELNVYTLHYKDAAFVVAQVPLKIYQPNRENLFMHQHVISDVMANSEGVIPVSFGNVFQSEEDVTVLLENLYPQFEKIFPEIKGKIEVGLKVVANKEFLDEKVKNHPDVQKVAGTVQSKTKEAGYYDRIKLGEVTQKLFQNLQQMMIDDIYAPLKELAEAAKTNDPIGEKMLLNASFLIDRDKEGAFDEMVNEIYEKWEGKLEFKYSGPWPAYNFVNIRLNVEAS
ncbi:GvpL/GvpF family gas vesicle protein [Priestia koreensis]|uniref:GvpL/GvpF family gas vesicle protein n=1 Tax=Priestia koreensis TaxID=284581 RepID=UPI00345AAA15